MKKDRFLIVDDDPVICLILSNIIEDNDLGDVVDSLNDGSSAVHLIPKFKPDIVFIDLLLPDMDGIEIVKAIKKENQDIDFIMISQVSDQDMVTEAYESGIEFYINKPINVIEVVSVTKRVLESQRNRRVLAQIGHTLNQNKQLTTSPKTENDTLNIIFAELGILSERGCEDLIEMVKKRIAYDKPLQMSELYAHVSQTYIQRRVKKSSSPKAIEQRVRRTIQTALINIANLGLEDFGHYKFDLYANALFGFQEVKRTMDAIRKEENIKPMINTKLFINGLISLLKNN